jgi:EAL domain-containing protein (putative c-di-GMP-specific phosphodiesterase class I)
MIPLRNWMSRPSAMPGEPGPSLPLCFVVNDEPATNRLIASVMQSAGVETGLFPNTPSFFEGLAQRTPDVIFFDVTPDTKEAIDAMFALGEQCYRGPVQLISSHGLPLAESVRHIGERQALKMLPVLKKPLDEPALRKLVREHKLEAARPATSIDLNEALDEGWVEFWLQPKINLRRKQVVGVESFARVRHPVHGVLAPGAFIPGASEGSLTRLNERVLVSALTASANLSKLGANLRLANNVSMAALQTLPIANIIREFRPEGQRWAGLIFDVTEDQIATDPKLVQDIMGELEPLGVKLAIDDFGRGQLSLGRLKGLSFAELKLDRTFVRDCATDASHAAICKSVIDLAHNFGGAAVAIGCEKGADVLALNEMGCDIGQGYLFGQPMPEAQLFALLRERAAQQKSAGRSRQ